MKMLAPTTIGTLFTALCGAVYVIIFASEFPLWTTLWRTEIMGASVVVLLTYLISWSFLELDDNLQLALASRSSFEYWVRVIAQCFLSGSLLALGIEFRAYLFMFGICFFAVLLWAIIVRNIPGAHAVRRIFWNEVVNCVLCLVYVVLAFLLCQQSLEFNRTYSVFATDAESFRIRVEHMRGQVSDLLPALGFFIGLMIMNMVWLASRTAWFRSLWQKRS